MLYKDFMYFFAKVDWFIRKYDRTIYLMLFGTERYVSIFNRIIYLLRIKSNILNVVLDDDLFLEKTLTMHNVVILIKSVFLKKRNQCYYRTFSENFSYKLTKNNDNKKFSSYDNIWFNKIKITKEEFHGTKKSIIIWDVDVDNIAHPVTGRRNNVVTTSLRMTQGRCRYASIETPSDVSVEHPQYVSVVRLHNILLVCLYGVSCNSQMKHPITLLW